MLGIVLVASILGGMLLFGYRRPGVMFGGAICIYALEQVAQVLSPFFWSHPAFINYAIGLLVLMGIVITFMQGQLSLRNFPTVGILVFCLYGWAILSVVWSPYRMHVISHLKDGAPYIFFFVVLTPLCFTQTRDLRAGLISTLLIGVPCVVFALYFADWTHRSLSFESHMAGMTTYGVAAGVSSNPLELGSIGGIVAIISALIVIQPIRKVWAILRWVLVALGLFLAVRSGSRGQAIGAVMVVFMLLPLSFRMKNARGVIGLGLAIMAAGMVSFLIFSSVSGSNRWTLDGMIESYLGGRWETSKMLLSHWWDAGPFYWFFGLGSSASYGVPYLGFYPHNVPLEVLGELGIVGFIVFVSIPVLTLLSVKRLLVQLKDFDEARGYVLAIFGIHLFYLILSLKQGSLIASTNIFMTAIALGMFENSYRRMRESAALSKHPVYSPSERLPLASATLPPRRI